MGKINIFFALIICTALFSACGSFTDIDREMRVVKVGTTSVSDNDNRKIKSGIDVFDLDVMNDYHQQLVKFDPSDMELADWANGGFFGCDFIEDNVRFEEDHLELWLTRASSDSKRDIEYSGAEYRTKNAYGYGLYTVKMKPVKNDGVVSSFFTYTRNSDKSNWDEIDIEFLGKDTSSVQFNFYSDGIGDHEYVFDLGFDASADFHEYGFLWLKDKIIWFVDSSPVYMVTDEDCDIPDTAGKIMMNVWNGANEKSTIKWLNKYDGTTDIHADYRSFVYTPLKK